MAPGVNVGTLEHAHTDNRRIIFECNFPASSVQQFVVAERIPLGNHYHKIRQETFIITNGEGRCVCLPLDIHEQPLGEKLVFTVSQGSVIQIMPFTAHAFLLEPGCSMVCFSSIPFNPDDTDIFACKLEFS